MQSQNRTKSCNLYIINPHFLAHYQRSKNKHVKKSTLLVQVSVKKKFFHSKITKKNCCILCSNNNTYKNLWANTQREKNNVE